MYLGEFWSWCFGGVFATIFILPIASYLAVRYARLGYLAANKDWSERRNTH